MCFLKTNIILLRSILHKIKKITGSSISEIKSIDYHGYRLFYSEGTSIINRFKSDGEYEPRVLACAERVLENVFNPVVFDIGANIGFFSLSVLKKYPNATIYAFEPGPHQFALFEETILRNQLKEKIKLFQVALGNSNGSAEFRIHSSEDASGDGFIDTERSGKTKKIIVSCFTLDYWLINNPEIECVNLLKMDTEGSEFWILNGSSEFFKKFKPIIIMEIYPMNIRNYPFELSDLLNRIADLGYLIHTLEGVFISPDELDKFLGIEDTFLLIHESKK